MDALVRRVVGALPTADGKVLIRDRAGDQALVDLVASECETRGLTPVIEHVSNAGLRNVIASLTPSELSRWDADRVGVAGEISGLIVLGAWHLDVGGLSSESVETWSAAMRRVEAVIERRRVPTVIVAVPTQEVSSSLGMPLEALEALVQPSMLLSAAEVMSETTGVLDALGAAATTEVRTPAGSLIVERGERPLLVDDGVVDAADLRAGATVSNMPAGSVYWTVLEEATRGRVELVDGSVLEFGDDGRVVAGSFAGERVSHLGVATNPLLSGAIGWAIVDEHCRGAVFLALGENRYLGGENASEINVDVLPAAPTVVVGDRIVVSPRTP